MTHLAAYDFVTGAGVAAYLYAAHVNAAAGVHIESKIRFVRVAVQYGIWVEVGKGVAQGAQVFGNGLGGGIGLGGREFFARFYFNQRLDLVDQDEKVASQIEAAHSVGLAFVKRRGNEVVVAVGGTRYLRGLGGGF